MAESSKPKKKVKSFNLRLLRSSLKYRPDIVKLIMKMRRQLKNSNILVKKLKLQLKRTLKQVTTVEQSTQTGDICGSPLADTNTTLIETNKDSNNENVEHSNIATSLNIENTLKVKHEQNTEAGWIIEEQKGEKSIAEQVKEAAQSAVQQSGMVYVDSAGMYYDYKTGYYYNSELGLYYHTDTDCYYYYSEEKQSYVFHSYPDRTLQNPALVAYEKKMAKKRNLKKKKQEEIDNLTKNLSQEKEENIEPKRRKISKKKIQSKTETPLANDKDENEGNKSEIIDDNKTTVVIDKATDSQEINPNVLSNKVLEDGECSDTDSESSNEDNESNASTSTAGDDDESIAKHHPPCMRIIVRETNLPKIKVGSLFMVTKDGGTIGREGDHHTIILKDRNVSRDHLDIKYDITKRIYTATDLGSKNGTVLNGTRMSESQIISDPMEVMHGSTMQLGETKLLCHIHAGNDTCGHCEPGLLVETQEKEKVAYTRTCSVQKQHQLELARLKNKYVPKQLCIEATEYNDRAQARRDTVGSTHHSEKTQIADLDTFIEPENKGFKMLEKMGWSKGEGLGKDNQGDTEPVPLVSNECKSGLGTAGAIGTPSLVPTKTIVNKLGSATLRLANRTKMLNPPAKAFQDTNENEDSE